MPGDIAAFWRALLQDLRGTARPIAARMRVDPHLADDAVQEAVMRLLVFLGEGAQVESPRAWLLTTTTRLLCDVARGRPGSIRGRWESRLAGSTPDLDGFPDSDVSPLDRAILNECWKRAPGLFDDLPPPYREIAILQYLREWTRADITAWLCSWRPISEHTCPAILRRTHEMVRHLTGGDDLRAMWPQRFNPKKNRWYAPPPRLFASLGVEAA